MIPRLVEKKVIDALTEKKKKIVLLLGPRQAGKTTLLKIIEASLLKQKKKVIRLNCDLEEDLLRINTFSLTALRSYLTGAFYLLIDEAQRLDDPGRTLKIIHDELPNIRVLATGSSSLNLRNKLSDALTGRYLDFSLYPFSLPEVSEGKEERADFLLPPIFQYGLYPEVYLEAEPEKKKVFLEKIVESYLFKDIFAFEKVRQPQVLKDLTRAIAYQIGSEINESELANRLKINRRTVLSYLDLLEQAFVIVRVFPFSKNPRREIGRNYKIYFIDLGIRNALIGDFNSLPLRADSGSLWENFLVIERLKKLSTLGQTFNYNFWRSYGGAEVDYLERSGRKTSPQAFEFKLNERGLSKGARSFSNQYKIPVVLINKNNYGSFIYP